MGKGTGEGMEIGTEGAWERERKGESEWKGGRSRNGRNKGMEAERGM